MPWRNMETLFVKVTDRRRRHRLGRSVRLWRLRHHQGCGRCRGCAAGGRPRSPADIAIADDRPARASSTTTAATGRCRLRCQASTLRCGTSPAKSRASRSTACSAAIRSTASRSYASLLRYRSPKLVAQFCDDAASNGYMNIKLHEIGVDEVAAARVAVGPHIGLMVDTNCPWTRRRGDRDGAAVRAVRADLARGAGVAARRLRRAGAGQRKKAVYRSPPGRTPGPLTDMAHLIDLATVDYVQPSVIKIGGVSEMIKVLVLAGARGVRLHLTRRTSGRA